MSLSYSLTDTIRASVFEIFTKLISAHYALSMLPKSIKNWRFTVSDASRDLQKGDNELKRIKVFQQLQLSLYQLCYVHQDQLCDVHQDCQGVLILLIFIFSINLSEPSVMPLLHRLKTEKNLENFLFSEGIAIQHWVMVA